MYRLRESDPAFAAQWTDALEETVESLEAEAWRRAVDGVEEPIVSRGEVVGSVKRYGDTLLIFLLKGHDPSKYRERHEVTSSLIMAGQPQPRERSTAAGGPPLPPSSGR